MLYENLSQMMCLHAFICVKVGPMLGMIDFYTKLLLLIYLISFCRKFPKRALLEEGNLRKNSVEEGTHLEWGHLGHESQDMGRSRGGGPTRVAS